MSEIDVPVVRVAFFVVQDKARIAMLKGLSELTAMPAHWPGAMMGLHVISGSSSSRAILKRSTEASAAWSSRHR